MARSRDSVSGDTSMLVGMLRALRGHFRRVQITWPPVPSEQEMAAANIGGGDYPEIGRDFLQYFIGLGGLKPTDAVLDIGCGLGRMAVPLADWLAPEARYAGFDVVPDSIRWCRKHITARRAGFRFDLLDDVRNTHYNARGANAAETVRFPYDDASFDFVFATSVFTHLVPGAASRYLAESRRVLRPGGRLFATWFLVSEDGPLTEAALELLPFDEGTHRVASRQVPEAVVGFPYRFVEDAYANAGLEPMNTIAGYWVQGISQLPYQDMIVARRP